MLNAFEAHPLMAALAVIAVTMALICAVIRWIGPAKEWTPTVAPLSPQERAQLEIEADAMGWRGM